MRRDDYVKGATSKIFSHSERKKVEAELNDHILKNKDFSEEIGYDAETAENKAVEKMGEYNEVADYLGELHNDFYNPVGDIIGFAIWLSSLGGLYYALKEYIFDDIGAIPITLAAICISITAYFIGAGAMLARNRIPVIIGTLLCGGATSAFIYFCTKNICSLVNDNFDILKNLILYYQLSSRYVPKDNIAFKAAIIFAAAAVIPILVSLIYYIKYHTQSNTLFDNHFKNHSKAIVIFISVLFIACSGFFVSRYFTMRNSWYDECRNTYQMLFDMTKACKTFDDVTDYLSSNKCNIDFTEDTDNDGNITGYSYSHSFIGITIEYQEEPDNERVNDTDDIIIGKYGLTTSNIDFEDSYDYEYRASMSLYFRDVFKNGLDTPSLKNFLTTEDELDEITYFDMNEHTDDENFDFYRKHIPNKFKAAPSKSHNNTGTYEFEYITGDKYKYTSDFEFQTIPAETIKEKQEIANIKNEIYEIVKSNLNGSNEEIAKRTNTTLIKPDMSYEDYSIAVRCLGTFFDNYKEYLLDSYDSLYYFKISDDLSFQLSGKPYKYIVFISNTHPEYIDYLPIKDEVKYSSFDSEPFKKMRVKDKGYYAKNKYIYDYEKIPYFEEDGTRYIYRMENEDPGDKSGYIKHYYLVSQKGDKYEDDICYINSDGYLYFDTAHKLKVQSDGLTYKDAVGNSYTRAFETSWDENGNIIPFKDN